MVVKVATTCLQWSQPIIPHSPSSSQTLASAISSPSSKRRNLGEGGALVCRFVGLDLSSLFGNQSSAIFRSRSCEFPFSRTRTIRRAFSANLEKSFSGEEFSKKIQELALRFQLSDNNNNSRDSEPEIVSDFRDSNYNSFCEKSSTMNRIVSLENPLPMMRSIVEHPWPEHREFSHPDWPGGDDNIPASIERKANSCDLPLSLRIIKRKLQWKQGFREAGESAYCSVNKAFSSMVFIIRELQSHSLQMREILYYEDLQGIISRVQKEMHASFVWLFQQVFSPTPTLMMYVMILLANFTVYSMGHNSAIAATPPNGSYPATMETVSVVESTQDQKQHKFDSSAIKTFSLSSANGKITSIGGNNGGGGKVRPMASGTDGEGGLERSKNYPTLVPDRASQLSSLGTTRETESVSGQESREEELAVWNSIVEEASKMQAPATAPLRDGTLQKFVSLVSAKIQQEDYTEYLRTELQYQKNLFQEPSNPLLLANYAQFLYLVAHDYDRAEEYFKRAIGVEPPDAEAFNKYATFLWRARNDLWGAEETFLEAISADPTNSFYTANYAHFLWNTGGEDTCFPPSSPDTSQDV